MQLWQGGLVEFLDSVWCNASIILNNFDSSGRWNGSLSLTYPLSDMCRFPRIQFTISLS